MNLQKPVNLHIADYSGKYAPLLRRQLGNLYDKNLITGVSTNISKTLDTSDGLLHTNILIFIYNTCSPETIKKLSDAIDDETEVILAGTPENTVTNLLKLQTLFKTPHTIPLPWAIEQLQLNMHAILSKIHLSQRLQKAYELNDTNRLNTARLISDVTNSASGKMNAYVNLTTRLCLEVGRRVKLDQKRLFNLQIAAQFHHIGLLGGPPELTQTHPAQLTGKLRKKYDHYPTKSAEILARNPMFKDVAEIVQKHQTNAVGGQPPPPMESRVLRICSFYAAAAKLRGIDKQKTLELINRRTDTWFDRVCMREFNKIISEQTGNVQVPVSLDRLKPGMRVAQDVVSESGRMVLSGGAVLTPLHLQRLKIYHNMDPIPEVYVFVESR